MRTPDSPIVLIEKDPAQAAEIRDALTQHGRLVHVVESVHDMDLGALTSSPHVVILDIDHSELPETDVRVIVEALSAGRVSRAIILMELSLVLGVLELLRDIRIKLLFKPLEAAELLAALDT